MPAADYISMLESELVALRKAVRCLHQGDLRTAARVVYVGRSYRLTLEASALVARTPGGYGPSWRFMAFWPDRISM